MRVTIRVNWVETSQDVEPRMLLVHHLRENLDLTGTHVGCDTSNCGACTVHMDGAAVKSCTVLAVQADGRGVTTIGGLGDGDTWHPVQQGFHECHGLQCGYCTPGMVMAAVALLEEIPDPTEAEIRAELEGNLCRCTGYQMSCRTRRARRAIPRCATGARATARWHTASDLPAVVLALGGTMVAQGPSGRREIAASDFFEGFLETALAPDELLVEVRVPRITGGWSFQKFHRRAQDWAIVGCAAARVNGSVGIALVNMASVPLRATATEQALVAGVSVADAAALAAEGTEAPQDIHGSSEYREHLARVLVQRALAEVG